MLEINQILGEEFTKKNLFGSIGIQDYQIGESEKNIKSFWRQGKNNKAKCNLEANDCI